MYRFFYHGSLSPAINGAKKAAKELNCTLLTATRMQVEFGDIGEYLIKNAIDGICTFSPKAEPLKKIEECLPKHVPGCSVYREGDKLKCLAIDHVKCGYIIAEHLLKLGHKKFLLVDYINSKNSSKRIEGIQQAFKEYGIIHDSKLTVKIKTVEQIRIKRSIESFVKNKEFTAAICFNDIMAMAVIEQIKESGYSIPNDFAVTGIDDDYMAATSRPTLTTVKIPLFEIGYNAIYYLHGKASGKEFNFDNSSIEPSLIIRESCGYSSKPYTDKRDKIAHIDLRSTLEQFCIENFPKVFHQNLDTILEPLEAHLKQPKLFSKEYLKFVKLCREIGIAQGKFCDLLFNLLPLEISKNKIVRESIKLAYDNIGSELHGPNSDDTSNSQDYLDIKYTTQTPIRHGGFSTFDLINEFQQILSARSVKFFCNPHT